MGKLLEEVIPLLDDYPKDYSSSPTQTTPPISLRFLISRAFGFLTNRLGGVKGLFRHVANDSLDPEQEPISSAPIWARRDSMDELEHGVSQQADCGYGATAPNIFRSTTQSYGTNSPPAATTDSLHIVFGVQGWRWSLMLQGIAIPETPCDSDFFKGLRQFHETHRFWVLSLVFRFPVLELPIC
jgi:hypothetical protein